MYSESQASEEYEQLCLQWLIPAVSGAEEARLSTEAIVVSALLLRLLEEMTGKSEHNHAAYKYADGYCQVHEEVRPNNHTLSASLLLRVTRHDDASSDIVYAAMAVALRQDIHIANMTRSAISINARDCNIDETFDQAPDYMWSLRMINLVAKATNFAYGESSRSNAEWEELSSQLQRWLESRPASFDPLNADEQSRGPSLFGVPTSSPSRDTIFPPRLYLDDCHIAGAQYAELCRVLLLAHNPTSPGLGPGRAEALRLSEDGIRDSVRNICGISMSNPECTPARIHAGLAIAMTGDYFVDPVEADALYDIISSAEAHVGWPALKVSPRLRQFWASCALR